MGPLDLYDYDSKHTFDSCSYLAQDPILSPEVNHHPALNLKV